MQYLFFITLKLIISYRSIELKYQDFCMERPNPFRKNEL